MCKVEQLQWWSLKWKRCQGSCIFFCFSETVFLGSKILNSIFLHKVMYMHALLSHLTLAESLFWNLAVFLIPFYIFGLWSPFGVTHINTQTIDQMGHNNDTYWSNINWIKYGPRLVSHNRPYLENWPDALLYSCVWLPAYTICSVQLDETVVCLSIK